jgi:flagellar biosynthesis/type III secretory pathway M-ring protein FliF/YscJ
MLLQKSLNFAQKNNVTWIAMLFIALITLVFWLNKPLVSVDSPENSVKHQLNMLLTPVLGAENFRIEVSQTRQDLSLIKQSVAVIVDETRQMSPNELDQINTLIRAAIGYDAARGDMIRVIAMPFQKQNAVMSLLSHHRDNVILLFELAILAVLAMVFVYYSRKKPVIIAQTPAYSPPSNERTLSDQVLEEPAKAAAIVRVWLRETAS